MPACWQNNIALPQSEWLNNLRTICSAVYLMVLKASQASRSGNKTSSNPTQYTQDTACLHADKTTLLCLRANGSTISARFAQQFIWWFSKHHRHQALAIKTSSNPTQYTQDTACLHADKTTLLCLRANGSTISAYFAQQFIWWFSKHHRHQALAIKTSSNPTQYTQDTAWWPDGLAWGRGWVVFWEWQDSTVVAKFN